MSTNSSNRLLDQKLASQISEEFTLISKEFSSYQKISGLTCIEGCGKCCFKPDIYCSPLELLPMALDLLNRGEAQGVYDRCVGKEQERCILLKVDNEEKFQARCEEYTHRPLVCRTFGVSARHGKNGKVDFSICKTIKEEKEEEFKKLVAKNHSAEDPTLPFIDTCKNRLATLDPRLLEEEFPVNQALKIILEKVLLHSTYLSK